MISAATTIFWIFLIIFAITAVYSVKDLHFEFGEPQMSTNADNDVVLSLPIKIGNGGLYDMGPFRVTTIISDRNGSTITKGFTSVRVVRRGENVTATHNMTIDVNGLIQSDHNYLTTDTELNFYVEVGLGVAEVIPVQVSTNLSVPWGAPFYNFTLGEPAYEAFNSTHARVTVPISFENHAFFDIAGAVQIKMYNNRGLLVGNGQTAVDTPQHSSYNGYVELYVSLTDMTPNGRLEVYFQTPPLNYGPLVFPYG
jgi:hypothetical protein